MIKRWLTKLVQGAVEEHLVKLESSRERYVACPKCGKSFDLTALGVAHNIRAVTVICDACKTHFEVRPSQFWNKIEVEARR